jgi:heme exporter protein C
MNKVKRAAWIFGLLGLALLIPGIYFALVKAPADREMGDVQRIMYVHVPSMWMALLAATLNFICSVTFLFRKSWAMDSLAESAAEIGAVFGALGLAQGSIWARPTWGVWWIWDARLTTAAIMVVAYVGYLALRRFVDDADRRALWSAVTAIIIYVDIPIVWYSVQWFNTLHQKQSSPTTVDPQMTFTLRWNAFAFLFLAISFLLARYRIAQAVRAAEIALPDVHAAATPAAGAPV